MLWRTGSVAEMPSAVQSYSVGGIFIGVPTRRDGGNGLLELLLRVFYPTDFTS